MATSMSWFGLICAKWIEKPCANMSIDLAWRWASIDSRNSLPWPASGVSTITTVASDTASGTGTARRPSSSPGKDRRERPLRCRAGSARGLDPGCRIRSRRPAHRGWAGSRRRSGSSCGSPHHHGSGANDVHDPVPVQLVDELADLLPLAGKLDRRAARSGCQHLCAVAQQAFQLRGGDGRDHQLAAVHLVLRQVLDLHDLDQTLQLLADLVSLGVAVIDLERDPEAPGFLARPDRDAADVKAAAANCARDLGQRVRRVLHQDREDPDLLAHGSTVTTAGRRAAALARPQAGSASCRGPLRGA